MKVESKLKRLFTHDWEAKLICLVLAGLLSWVVNDQIRRSEPQPLPPVKLEMPPGWPMAPVPEPVVPRVEVESGLPEPSLSLPVAPGEPR